MTDSPMTDLELKTWLVQMGYPSDTLSNCVDARDSRGMTLLMHAARRGEAAMVRALLSRNADPAALNADSNGALWFACFADCGDCLAVLIDAGAPLNNQNVNGATALIYCASAGKAERVRQLLEAGADAGLRTLDDYTALDSASTRACLHLLRERERQPA